MFHKDFCMNSIKRLFIVLGFCFTLGNSVYALTTNSQSTYSTSEFDWSKIVDAIIQVESNGDANAKNGNQVGAMQITPIMVAECNDILKRRKSKKRFKLTDRYSLKKSKEMFLLIQSHYNPSHDIEKAIRSWNGGQRYSLRGTQAYFEKVLRYLK